MICALPDLISKSNLGVDIHVVQVLENSYVVYVMSFETNYS